jgi:hypothetical protein
MGTLDSDQLDSARVRLSTASEANRAAKARLSALAGSGEQSDEFAAAEAEVQRTDRDLSQAAEEFRRANEP